MSNAPVPSPRTFGVNEFETAAYLNSVRDALNFLLNRPLLRVWQGTAQSVNSGAFTACTYDSSTVDTYGMHSNTTNNSRAVAQVAGWYTFGAGSGFASSATATHSRGGSLFKNGSSLPDGGSALVMAPDANGVAVVPMAPFPVFLNVGDYVEWDLFQASTAALSTNAGGQFCSYLTARWDHV